MCGIARILAAARGPVAVRNDVAAMAACLEHRGLDDSGVAAGPGCALGVRRLAIQDTRNARHQPVRLRDPVSADPLAAPHKPELGLAPA